MAFVHPTTLKVFFNFNIMQDIIKDIDRWLDQESDFVAATVIKTWGSGPRKVGSGMVIGSNVEILGSVSGGCVEGDVIKQSQEVRQTGERKILRYGVTDDQAWEVGLSCGGQIEILLERVDPQSSGIWKELSQNVLTNHGVALVSPTLGSSPSRLIGSEDSNDAIAAAATEAYKKRKSGLIEIEDDLYFINVFPKKSQLIIVGAAHISSQLVELASLFGFETIVIDPRGLFTNKTEFSVKPDISYDKWPVEVLEDYDLNSDVYAVMLTHDPKIDDQALHILLKSGVSYIGALGSKKTHAKRTQRLTDAGFSEEEISRIHAPIGVDINAKNPGEIALSIVGELIKTRNQFL